LHATINENNIVIRKICSACIERVKKNFKGSIFALFKLKIEEVYSHQTVKNVSEMRTKNALKITLLLASFFLLEMGLI
jgi:hypothetical protein